MSRLLFGFAIFFLGVLTLSGCNSTSEKSAMDTESNALISLNVNAHTGLIKGLIVTKDKDIITASEDKTIRVWDSETGKEKRRILGQIGYGANGMINAIALSQDEKYLAVGGWLGYNDKINVENHIRIYDYKSGKLIYVLNSHTNVVHDLAFSEDGKYLISGSHDGTAKIWSTEDNFSLLDTISFHKGSVFRVGIIKQKLTDKYFAITVGDDSKIALYDLDKKRVVKYRKFDNTMHLLVTNSKIGQGHIAVGSLLSDEVVILDFDLNYVREITLPLQVSALTYSKGGQYLIIGGYGASDTSGVYLVSDNYRFDGYIEKGSYLTQQIDVLDKKTAVSAVIGSESEIFIWDIKTKKILKEIKGKAEHFANVGIRNNKLALGGDIGCQGEACAQFEKVIDLSNFSIHNFNQEDFNLISNKQGLYSLSTSIGGLYGDIDAVLDIEKDSKRVANIVRGKYLGDRHMCFGWYKNLIVSGGAHGNLRVYNKSGEEVARLSGHTGDITSIALEGDTLVSISIDDTIRLWNLSGLSAADRNKVLLPTLNLFISKNDEYVAWTEDGYFTASKNGANLVGYHINQGVNKEARYVSMAQLYNDFYRPDLIERVLKGEDISDYSQDLGEVLRSISHGN